MRLHNVGCQIVLTVCTQAHVVECAPCAMRVSHFTVEAVSLVIAAASAIFRQVWRYLANPRDGGELRRYRGCSQRFDRYLVGVMANVKSWVFVSLAAIVIDAV